jgi:hypothetical protein
MNRQGRQERQDKSILKLQGITSPSVITAYAQTQRLDQHGLLASLALRATYSVFNALCAFVRHTPE